MGWGWCCSSRVALDVAAALHQDAGATLHVAEHGHEAVAQLCGLACGTHVTGIEANAMCPTIEDNGSSVGIGGLLAMVMVEKVAWGTVVL